MESAGARTVRAYQYTQAPVPTTLPRHLPPTYPEEILPNPGIMLDLAHARPTCHSLDLAVTPSSFSYFFPLTFSAAILATPDMSWSAAQLEDDVAANNVSSLCPLYSPAS